MREKITEIDGVPLVVLPQELLDQAGFKIGDEVMLEFMKDSKKIHISRTPDLSGGKDIKVWSEDFIRKHRDFYDKLKDK